MKVEHINPFIIATRKVLNTMAFTESTSGKPFLKKDNDTKALGDISAVIELDGEGKGSIAISFNKSCILNIAQKMFGEEFHEIDAEITDMVGEIVNMVSGEARRELAKMGFQFSAGLPVSSKGVNHSIKHFVDGRVILIPFNTEFGAYYIEACFESKKISA